MCVYTHARTHTHYIR